jgi:putative colanic acid biosynthesis acetyltransferase WcaF
MMRTLPYEDRLSLGNKVGRAVWGLVWLLLYFPSPACLHPWRRCLLRLFGARIGAGVHVYPSSRVWAPWNLEMADDSCLGRWVDCYCVGRISIGKGATVSQYAFLCAASHDIRDAAFRLCIAPISIGASAWVAAGAFVGPGVSLGEGAVLGARACAFKDLKPWAVAGGNPARPLSRRVLRERHDR